MEPSSGKRYWFYAKRYGYGWGLPATWEGWVVFVGYLAGVFGGLAVFPPDKAMGSYAVCLTVLTVVLMIVCFVKGEPARWRWGNSSDVDAPGDSAARWDPGKTGMLVMHIFLGPVILGIAIFFRVYPPAEINHTYGYRTATAMRSQEAWDEAQLYSANVMIVAGVVIVLYQALSSVLMRPGLSLATSTVVLLLAIFAVLPITEAHLKNTFDGQGRRLELRAP
jgi:uncharacterized membrane protein